MSKIVMIASGKGGVGKTTATAMLGAQLSRLDKKTVMIDVDFGLRNLDLLFSLDERIRYNIADVLQGICSINQACVSVMPGLYLIPGTQNHHFSVSGIALERMLKDLSDKFDYILFDTSAGITDTHEQLLPYMDVSVLVTTWDAASLSDALSIRRFLQQEDIPCYLLLNELKPIPLALFLKREIPGYCEHFLDCRYAGNIPYRKKIQDWNFQKKVPAIENICLKL